MPESQILRRADVELRTQLSKASIYRLMRASKFPRPVRLGPRAVGWIASEITAWIESRERASIGGDASSST